jgi:hypothetical protein
VTSILDSRPSNLAHFDNPMRHQMIEVSGSILTALDNSVILILNELNANVKFIFVRIGC